MHDEVSTWSSLLDEHFLALSQQRAQFRDPVFAIEHGLPTDDIGELIEYFRTALTRQDDLNNGWLVWIVVLAELGYNYDGGEYWDSVGDALPDWNNHHRDFVPDWFDRFRKHYGGYVPTGPWASHFRIIAWPISHAILPRYLQRQFIRFLYDNRYRLASLGAWSPLAVGRALDDASTLPASRLGKFLQQHELCGRLALGLLADQEAPHGGTPIHGSTLERIITNLKERQWLDETKSVIKFRRGSLKPSVRSNGAASENANASRVGVRMHLRREPGDGWTPILQVTGFKALATRVPTLRNSLIRSRIRVAGLPGQKPGQWLFADRRVAALQSWPNPSSPILQFNPECQELSGVIGALNQSRRRDHALFAIGQSGRAFERAEPFVVPGSRYILVTTTPLEISSDLFESCQLNCEDAQAIYLSIPARPTAAHRAVLQRLGLSVVRSLTLWPAGLMPHDWDGSGYGEWLTTHQILLAVRTDFDCDHLEVSLDNQPITRLASPLAGDTTYCRLPNPGAGVYHYSIAARSRDREPELARANLTVSVREPEQWQPGSTSHNGLVVDLEPPDASLDDLPTSALSLSVFGPDGYNVNLSILFRDSQGEIMRESSLAKLIKLPVTPEIVRQHIRRFLERGDNDDVFADAASGTLNLGSEALGYFSYKFERETHPLRWIVKAGAAYTAKLIDDTGRSEKEIACDYYPLQSPNNHNEITNAVQGKIQAIAAPGGLLVARAGDEQDSVVVSTGLTGSRMQDLGVTSIPKPTERTPQAIWRDLSIFANWRSARCRGLLAESRKGTAADAVLAGVYSTLYGKRWVSIEQSQRQNPEGALDLLKRSVDRLPSFAAAIAMNGGVIDDNAIEGIKWFVERASLYEVSDDPQLCTFAVRIASEPLLLCEEGTERFLPLCKELLDNCTLARAARYLAYSSALRLGHVDSTFIMPRWSWSLS